MAGGRRREAEATRAAAGAAAAGRGGVGAARVVGGGTAGSVGWRGGGQDDAEAAGGPEIVVTLGSEEILDNRTSPPVSFGTVAQSQTPPELTFVVHNSGMATLTLGSVQVPSRYSVIESLASSLAPYASDSFTVRLNTAYVGTFAGQISFSTNDADENPFNFSITGQVISAGPAPEIAVYAGAGEIADGQTNPADRLWPGGSGGGGAHADVHRAEPGHGRLDVKRRSGSRRLHGDRTAGVQLGGRGLGHVHGAVEHGRDRHVRGTDRDRQ